MSDPLTTLRTYLLTQSGVTSAVSTRIYFDNLPQNATMPSVVCYLAATTLVRHVASADALRRAIVTLEVYGTDHSDVETAGAAIVTALEKKSGTWDSVAVRQTLIDNVTDTVESPEDGSETFRRVRIITVIMWHT